MPESAATQTPQKVTVGAAVAAFLDRCGVKAAFGVISIHNMPILDAFGERGTLRFVPARGEVGAANMADAYARVTGGLGVCVTSTGTAAGNSMGAMVEALTAGTPLLQITAQIESPYLDQDLGYIHEATHQLEMFKAVTKAAFRVHKPEMAIPTLREAVRIAMTAPTGPVAVEIPIDIQKALLECMPDTEPAPVELAPALASEVDALADALAGARRPLLWLGGGARGAGAAVRRLLDLGFGAISSVQGRGTVPEDDPRSLGAFTLAADVEDFYQTCDALLVVGSRLRSNETLTYRLKLPQPLYRIDVNPLAQGRCYPSQRFVCGDASQVLHALADRLEGRMAIDPRLAADLKATRARAEEATRRALEPYGPLVDAVQQVAGRDFNWVRDITLSNSIWGNRLLRVFDPRAGVHALGGGIGEGLAMGIGAATAAAVGDGRKTLCLAGDGGFIMNVGELATAVQEKLDLTIILMNDGGYGVIKNIQADIYGSRHHYVDLHTPDYELLARSLGVGHQRVSDLSMAEAALSRAVQAGGVQMVEIDMRAIGAFKQAFAGPPIRKKH